MGEGRWDRGRVFGGSYDASADGIDHVVDEGGIAGGVRETEISTPPVRVTWMRNMVCGGGKGRGGCECENVCVVCLLVNLGNWGRRGTGGTVGAGSGGGERRIYEVEEREVGKVKKLTRSFVGAGVGG
eukprot:GFKZ01003655.1.p2 GENE.GFKZ01003655.1~~GFKZ01003655.1.p2  ORF type:complete len:128 (+),score=19.19 GFKZ01003655.1:171-554(+)